MRVKYCGEEQADQRQQRADACGVEILREADDADQRCGVHAQTGVLQADEGDEQTDTNRNTLFERQRNGIEDGLTDVGERQDDKDQALNEYGQQSDLPAVAVACNNGVRHEGVQTHAGRERERQVCHKRHAQRAQAGCQSGCQQYRGGIHTGGAEYARVYGKDVRHGHKGSDTGHDLGLDCGFVFR